jgi:hypothetical protein
MDDQTRADADEAARLPVDSLVRGCETMGRPADELARPAAGLEERLSS